MWDTRWLVPVPHRLLGRCIGQWPVARAPPISGTLVAQAAACAHKCTHKCARARTHTGYGAAPDFEAADFAAPPAEFAAPPPPTPMAAAPPADAFGGCGCLVYGQRLRRRCRGWGALLSTRSCCALPLQAAALHRKPLSLRCPPTLPPRPWPPLLIPRLQQLPTVGCAPPQHCWGWHHCPCDLPWAHAWPCPAAPSKAFTVHHARLASLPCANQLCGALRLRLPCSRHGPINGRRCMGVSSRGARVPAVRVPAAAGLRLTMPAEARLLRRGAVRQLGVQRVVA